MNNQQGTHTIHQVNTSVLGCPFMTESMAGGQNLELLAYTVPVCAILVCNTVFLIWIMGVRIMSTLFNYLCVYQGCDIQAEAK